MKEPCFLRFAGRTCQHTETCVACIQLIENPFMERIPPPLPKEPKNIEQIIPRKRKKRLKKWDGVRLTTWSKAVLVAAGGLCQRCGGKANHAHHVEPKSKRPDLAFDLSNGIAVCAPCHAFEHRKDFPHLARLIEQHV